MKKHSIARYLFIGMTAFLFVACSQEEEAEKMNAPIPLKVMINESQSTHTRASLSGLSTEFESGDTIGIFVMNEYTTAYYNIPYVFNGSNWELATGEFIPSNVSFLENCEYFAYYPYKESLNGWPNYYDSDEDGTITADEYFSNIIEGWTVQSDQSTKANYNASDLMAGKGTITSTTDGIVSFTLDHKMGLIKIIFQNANGGQVTEISATSVELFTADTYIPYQIDYEFYQIAKPNTLFSLTFKPPVEFLDAQVDTVTPRPGRLSVFEYMLY